MRSLALVLFLSLILACGLAEIGSGEDSEGWQLGATEIAATREARVTVRAEKSTAEAETATATTQWYPILTALAQQDATVTVVAEHNEFINSINAHVASATRVTCPPRPGESALERFMRGIALPNSNGEKHCYFYYSDGMFQGPRESSASYRVDDSDWGHLFPAGDEVDYARHIRTRYLRATKNQLDDDVGVCVVPRQYGEWYLLSFPDGRTRCDDSKPYSFERELERIGFPTPNPTEIGICEIAEKYDYNMARTTHYARKANLETAFFMAPFGEIGKYGSTKDQNERLRIRCERIIRD